VAPRHRTTKLALATVVVLAAVAASANAALASSSSGSTSIRTTHVFASDSGSGGTDWWPFLSK
jgi:ABC-type glycerol-3-phosphate transport system substrate-binding protein